MVAGVCERSPPGVVPVAKKSGKDRKKDRHVRPRESFHMDPDLHEAFVRYVEDHPEGADKTGVLVAAVKMFLASKGRWPPQGSKR
jgi:hypothetical protein